jgi:hypothetical protein
MLKYDFIEDIFLDFYPISITRGFPLQPQDRSASSNFYEIIANKDTLTENQSRYLLKILDKYKIVSEKFGLSYKSDLENARWKLPFRVIDYTKKISVEKDEENRIWILAKFPYSFKSKFETEFLVDGNPFGHSKWDANRKVRKIPFYSINIISFYNFCRDNDFEIDESFLSAMDEVEEIWNRSEEIENSCVVVDGEVCLINAKDEILDFWNSNRNKILTNDLLLAKSMGFLLKQPSKNPTASEIISSSEENIFWISDFDKFFSITKQVVGKICILIDRVSSRRDFLEEFLSFADKNSIQREEIKVCHRESNQANSEFNDWVKENSLGGKVADGKYLIFNHKPSKWLFQEENSVKIVVTNGLYTDTSTFVRDWINHHSCVIYLGPVKPSLQKEKKIVNL